MRCKIRIRRLPYTFLVVLTIVAVGLLTININNVRAQVGLEVNPDTISLNGSTTATLCAGTTGYTITTVELVDPNNNTYASSANVGLTLNPGDCVTWTIPDDFSGLSAINQVGTWVLEINTNPGNQQRAEFAVSLFVIPENMIGAIAITGTSLAVFSGYLTLRKKNEL